MRFIEIELNGTVVRAQLESSRAPATAAALWQALPFEGDAVHTYGSGEMIRLLDAAPLADVALEAKTSFQHPGSVVYYPPAKEIAICYGSARFAGGLDVCALAEMEGDLKQFAANAARLQFDGAGRVRFRRAADQETGFRYPQHPGRKIELDLGGAKAVATLLEELAPSASGAFAKLLPLEGRAANDIFGGQILRFFPSTTRDLELEVSDEDRHDRAVVGLWPGVMYWYPEARGVILCYGDGLYIGGPWWSALVVPLARLDGDWSSLRAKASTQFRTGASPFEIRLQ